VHQPFEIFNAAGHPQTLLVCDHASRDIPPELGSLGLDAARLDEHIAWDLGAGELVRGLALALDIPAVLSGYSRLVVDCNRHLDESSAFPTVSDRVLIPGNQGLDAAARRLRAERCYWPYHAAIQSRIDAAGRVGHRPALIAIHSFTPRLNGSVRPWHVGVLWDRDARIAVPLLAELGRRDGLVVGDNEPYSGRHPANYTVGVHAASAGLPHVGIEVRQDLLADARGISAWVEILRDALVPILAGFVAVSA
jgi:predicted N-formylglutamate amidohydrolase